jgi:hypothetical protein
MPPKRKSANAAAKSAAAAPAVDWSKKTVAQLKAECKKLGLDCDGKKAELVERLQENGDGLFLLVTVELSLPYLNNCRTKSTEAAETEHPHESSR